MAAVVKGIPAGIQASRVSPAYLHGNSTSHTWAFSAIAEIIDNAYDPDVNASEIWIDQRIVDKKTCLTFVDNGNGMEPDKLHKMLSFGYCEKQAYSTPGHQAVGQYGNGFKSGSMRLGKDAIVFSRTQNSMSVGLLSQTYLQNIKAETVLVPIVTWLLPSKMKKQGPNVQNNLKAICRHSIFKNEEELLEELEVMAKLITGTKIMIYNLTRRQNNTLELDFMSNPHDIRNPQTHVMDYSTINRAVADHTPEYMVSLREYCSILFLKPRMKIVLRGKKVKTKLIMKSLSRTETDVYRPTWAPKPIPIKFGFNSQKNAKDYGIMMYHKNRLIRAYEKVGFQKQPNELGIGVVGVVEAYFLTPTHNKQDFSKDDKYNAFMSSVALKLNDYWNEKIGFNKPNALHLQHLNTPDWTWAQCDNCLQWRRLPMGYNSDNLPDKWFCHLNPDAQYNRCDIPEEPEDEDDALRGPSYKKTFKKAQLEHKERLRLQEVNQHKAKEMALIAKEKALQQKEVELLQKSVAGPSNAKNSDIEYYKKQAEQQQKIIRNLQEQKKKAEENCRILENAKSMKVVSLANGQDERSPNNRVSSSTGKPNDQICIKTEDGDVVAMIPLDKASSKALESNKFIDLTIDSDEEQEGQPSLSKKPRLDNKNGEDVKPDLSKVKVEKESEVSTSSSNSCHSQTDLSGADIAGLEKNSEMYKRKWNLLQKKVHKLLKIIVPDVDIGDADGVDLIVTEMIKHNQTT